MMDPEGRITHWLPGAAAVFGWSAEEARASPSRSSSRPKTRSRVRIAKRSHGSRQGHGARRALASLQGWLAGVHRGHAARLGGSVWSPPRVPEDRQDVTERRRRTRRCARARRVFEPSSRRRPTTRSLPPTGTAGSRPGPRVPRPSSAIRPRRRSAFPWT
jgi:PAS domain-containing protein